MAKKRQRRGAVAAVGAVVALLAGLVLTTPGHRPSAAATTTTLPAGVTLTAIDGGTTYYDTWTNSFPDGLFPIGVFPTDLAPADLATMHINFFTPMRNEIAPGTWSPVWDGNHNSNDQAGVIAQGNFYSGGDYEGVNCTSAQDPTNCASSQPWGSTAVFNVFGDELDGNCGNQFDNNPADVTNALTNHCGSWGGVTTTGLSLANSDTLGHDSTRPVYDQFTVTLMDGNTNNHYFLSQKKTICASANIFSFDIYPIVKRGGQVYNTYDQTQEARLYCQDNVPVFPFIETDHMDNTGGTGSICPAPAQVKAEVWNAVIGGADGIQYFDQYGNLADTGYTGCAAPYNYTAGAMYNTIQAVNAHLVTLTPWIQGPSASGYETHTGNVSTSVKYYDGHFYLFAASHQTATQNVTFTITGSPSGSVPVDFESRSVTMTSGSFTDAFADANAVHIYEIS